MARVTFGFGISDVRGKVGGAVFGGTRSGTILKNKSIQTHRESGAVTLIRSYMSQNNYSWNQMTDTQRNSWLSFNQMIRTRQVNNHNLFISSKQLFLKYNQYRLLYDLNPLVSLDFSETSVQPVIFTVELQTGLLMLVTSRIMQPTNEFIILSLTQPVRPTLNNPGNIFRFVIFPTTAAQVYNISSLYISIFGVLPSVGQTLFFKAANLNFKSPVGINLVTKKVTLT